MKHVREDLPDVQRRRPEVSAGLAAILDRMTAKDLRKRYPDALSLQADLEEALARELARTGQSTGEATAVLRTLPESARRRLPLRMRRPLPIVAIVALLGRRRRARRRAAQGGRRPHPARHRARARSSPSPAPASSRSSAPRRTDFDPAGDDEEHDGEAPLAVDKDPGTDWTHRGLQRRRPRQGGRRHLRRRRPGRRRALDRDRHARSRLEGGDPRRRRHEPAEGDLGGWEKVAGGTVDAQAQALPPRRRPPPLLPGLDHRPRAGRRAREDLRDHALRAAR